MPNYDKNLDWTKVSDGEYICNYSPSGTVVDLQSVLDTLQKPLPSRGSDIESWEHILPTPPQHAYATTPPVDVLMRCAERYDIESYTTQ